VSEPSGDSILVIDDNRAFTASLARHLRPLGVTVWSTPTIADAQVIAPVASPKFIILEPHVCQGSLAASVRRLEHHVELNRIIVVTVYPSLPMAVQAIRIGLGGFLTKPVSVEALLETMHGLEDTSKAAQECRPLERTVWEYLTQTYDAAGSITEAARRLRVDRRSLRRMLAKFPSIP
jgi:two-component system response regulator RegA